MTAYTGEVITSVSHRVPDGWPVKNPWYSYRAPAAYQNPGRKVALYAIKDQKTAIGTDSYTYTLFLPGARAVYVDAVYLIDPIGVAADSTNYNTITVMNSATTVCSQTTARGIIPGEVFEVTRANTEANRAFEPGATLTMVVTGTASGAVINKETLVVIVYHTKVPA